MCPGNDILRASCLIAMTHEPLNMIQGWIWHMSTLTNTILTPWEHILVATKYCKPHHMENTHSTPSEHILHFQNTWKSHVLHPQKPFSLRQTTSQTTQYGKHTLENLQNTFYTFQTCNTFKTPEQHTFYTFKTPQQHTINTFRTHSTPAKHATPSKHLNNTYSTTFRTHSTPSEHATPSKDLNNTHSTPSEYIFVTTHNTSKPHCTHQIVRKAHTVHTFKLR